MRWPVPRRAALALAAVLLVVATALLAWPRSRWALVERLPPAWRASAVAWRHGVQVQPRLAQTMRDGTRLQASLYRPRDASGALPTVLIRLPYGRHRYRGAWEPAIDLARHGFAVLVQDLRGTGESGGELRPWRHAAQDGWDTLDWIQQQPWSNGRVGTLGCSALGETQWALAALNHPAHRAMVPSGAGGAVGALAGRHSYFGVFEGGVFQLASGFGWFVDHGSLRPDAVPAMAFERRQHLARLPVADLVAQVRPAPNGYAELLATPLGSPEWAARGYLDAQARPRVPVLEFNTWGDQTVGDTLAAAEALRQALPQVPRSMVLGPGDHCGHAVRDNGPWRFGDLTVEQAAQPVDQWTRQWLAHWLGDGSQPRPALPAYRYFMLVDNRWRDASAWPPPQARAQRWYLASDGQANTRSGNGRLAQQPDARSAGTDHYRYDPRDPVPSRGGPLCCTGDASQRAGPADQADVEARRDVLVYTSAPLAQDLRIAGPLVAHLRVASDAPDTDLVARLVHVWPDGRATSVQEGALRLRWRSGMQQPQPLVPGEAVDVAVDMRAVAYLLPRGHRLRLHVTSSSFPRLSRNTNTGQDPHQDQRTVVATQTLHHGVQGLSWLALHALP